MDGWRIQLLQALDGFVVALRDLRFERLEVNVIGGTCTLGRNQGGSGDRPLQKEATIEGSHDLHDYAEGAAEMQRPAPVR